MITCESCGTEFEGQAHVVECTALQLPVELEPSIEESVGLYFKKLEEKGIEGRDLLDLKRSRKARV